MGGQKFSSHFRKNEKTVLLSNPHCRNGQAYVQRRHFQEIIKSKKKIAEDEIFKFNARMTSQGQKHFRKSC
jgi:hypothetical protein